MFYSAVGTTIKYEHDIIYQCFVSPKTVGLYLASLDGYLLFNETAKKKNNVAADKPLKSEALDNKCMS